METLKPRHELKHIINKIEMLGISKRLCHIASFDKNTDVHGRYKVRSLYFDNYNDKALVEKINGFNQREKFRLRYYNDNLSFIKLEKKSKKNGLCTKQSEIITTQECEKLLAGDILFLKESGKPLFLEFYLKMAYQQLRPKNIVDYTRQAFIYRPGNVRVTLDSDIRSGLLNGDFFNPKLSTISVGSAVVAEIKYDEFLPQIISDMVNTSKTKATAFSKYAACRIF
ncbi:MAG: hypothetical protein K0R90_1435 [Oscillospiraceae bacterium]|jgi:hypothetical protein|nr:hypothetical protein [Oscillospiraceae bacterium]